MNLPGGALCARLLSGGGAEEKAIAAFLAEQAL